MDAKHRIRDNYKFYSQDLINNLFSHPYPGSSYCNAIWKSRA